MLWPEWFREGGISFFAEELRENGVELPPPGTRLNLAPERLYEASFQK